MLLEAAVALGCIGGCALGSADDWASAGPPKGNAAKAQAKTRDARARTRTGVDFVKIATTDITLQ